MTRWLAVFVVIILCGGTARADGFVKLGFEIAAKPKPTPAQAGAPPSASEPASADAVEPDVKVGLFRQRAAAQSQRPDLVYVPSTPVEVPRRQGFSLGDDRDWRVQATQVGVMVGAFAALVALCGNGKCMW